MVEGIHVESSGVHGGEAQMATCQPSLREQVRCGVHNRPCSMAPGISALIVHSLHKPFHESGQYQPIKSPVGSSVCFPLTNFARNFTLLRTRDLRPGVALVFKGCKGMAYSPRLCLIGSGLQGLQGVGSGLPDHHSSCRIGVPRQHFHEYAHDHGSRSLQFRNCWFPASKFTLLHYCPCWIGMGLLLNVQHYRRLWTFYLRLPATSHPASAQDPSRNQAPTGYREGKGYNELQWDLTFSQ
eukprot:1139105-Pelagomonas_calceolata.AAC.1